MGDEDREVLAEALRLNDNPPIWPRGYERQLERLLPVVDAIARRRAAEELRAAAEESTYWAMTRETVYTRLNARADALDSQ